MGQGWWVSDLLQAGEHVRLFSWFFWVLLSICLHELAHGLAAIQQGDDTPIVLRRMTLNPAVHMGAMSLIAFLVLGIAWGQMPVNPARFRWGRWGHAFVAAAGPATNALLALVALTTMVLWDRFAPAAAPANFNDNLLEFLWLGGMLNVVLALFNLVPVPPLDGSRIAAAASRAYSRFLDHPNADQIALLGLLALFFLGSDYIFFAAADAARAYVDWLARALA